MRHVILLGQDGKTRVLDRRVERTTRVMLLGDRVFLQHDAQPDPQRALVFVELLDVVQLSDAATLGLRVDDAGRYVVSCLEHEVQLSTEMSIALAKKILRTNIERGSL